MWFNTLKHLKAQVENKVWLSGGRNHTAIQIGQSEVDSFAFSSYYPNDLALLLANIPHAFKTDLSFQQLRQTHNNT